MRIKLQKTVIPTFTLLTVIVRPVIKHPRQIAQLVEHLTRDLGNSGSKPRSGRIFSPIPSHNNRGDAYTFSFI